MVYETTLFGISTSADCQTQQGNIIDTQQVSSLSDIHDHTRVEHRSQAAGLRISNQQSLIKERQLEHITATKEHHRH